MQYPLAKLLKEAGFPQATEFYHEEFEHVINQRYHRPYHLYGIKLGDEPSQEQGLIADPSLQELIEACGEDYQLLSRKSQNGRGLPQWKAVSNIKINKVGIRHLSRRASDPLTAVAYLWIVLQVRRKQHETSSTM